MLYCEHCVVLKFSVQVTIKCTVESFFLSFYFSLLTIGIIIVIKVIIVINNL